MYAMAGNSEAVQLPGILLTRELFRIGQVPLSQFIKRYILRSILDRKKVVYV